MSVIAELRGPTVQQTPFLSIDTTKSCRANFLPPLLRVAGSSISACCCYAAVIKPQNTTGGPDVCNDPLSPDLHTTWARCAQVKTS